MVSFLYRVYSSVGTSLLLHLGLVNASLINLMKFLFASLLLLATASASSEPKTEQAVDPSPKLYVYKTVRENYIVNGRDLTVDLKVYNGGKG